MIFTFKNIIIHVENTSVLGYESLLRIKLEEMVIFTTDSNWEHRFMSNLSINYKQISISKFSVSLAGAKGISFHNVKEEEKEILKVVGPVVNENRQKKLKEKESFILNPIDVKIRLKLRKNTVNKTSISKDPLSSVSIEISKPIVIMLTKDQIIYLSRFSAFLNGQFKIQNNLGIRPTKTVYEDRLGWLRYAVKAVIDKIRKKRFNWSYGIRKIFLIKKYISLYKRKQNIIHVPWLAPWNTDEFEAFKKCEEFFHIKELIKFREWAFIEIRIEAKRYFNSQKDGHDKIGTKPILDIWSNVINNEDAFSTKGIQEKDLPVQLSETEILDLYEILSMDKGNVLSSYLKGEFNSSEDITIQLNLSINRIWILLVDDQYPKRNMTPEIKALLSKCDCAKCENIESQSPFLRTRSKFTEESNSDPELEFESVDNKDEIFLNDSVDDHIKDLYSHRQFKQKRLERNEKAHRSAVKIDNNRKIILVFYIEKISGSIEKFRNRRLRTNEDKPLKINEFKIFTLDSLRIQKENQNFKEFYEDMYKLIKFKDSHLTNSEMHFANFINFLSKIGLEGISRFMEEIEKDKDAIEKNYEFENMKRYFKFFDPRKGNTSYIHVAKRDFEDYSNLLEVTKQNINEEEGDLFLPSAIDYLAKIGSKDIAQQNDINDFSISFLLPGIPSNFKIVSLEVFTRKTVKRKGKKEKYKSTVRREFVEGIDETEGFFNFTGKGFDLIKLGSRSLSNLLAFVKFDNNKTTEFSPNQNLLYSLRVNHDFFKILNEKKKKKLKVNVKICLSNLEGQFIETSPIYKNYLVMNIIIRKLEFATIDFTDEVKAPFYNSSKIALHRLLINLKIKNKDELDVESLNSIDQVLIDTNVLIIQNKLILKSHPFLPNSQVPINKLVDHGLYSQCFNQYIRSNIHVVANSKICRNWTILFRK